MIPRRRCGTADAAVLLPRVHYYRVRRLLLAASNINGNGPSQSRRVRALRHDPPAAPAVRDMLGRILSSETFKRSERARSLLAYLVDREQAGDADKLKGYAIAVDVFGKDAAFDASTDALVRVQAGRLRELLSHYYESEGEADPIRIIVPRGTYVPAYQAVSLPGEA